MIERWSAPFRVVIFNGKLAVTRVTGCHTDSQQKVCACIRFLTLPGIGLYRVACDAVPEPLGT